MIRNRWPDMLLLPFASSSMGTSEEPVLPATAAPGEIPKLVGVAVLKQHQHTEITSSLFMYVDRHRLCIHVSDGVCELLGMRREEIIGATIDALTYSEAADASGLFTEYLHTNRMQGSYVLRHAKGHQVPVTYDAHIFEDGCMGSSFTTL